MTQCWYFQQWSCIEFVKRLTGVCKPWWSAIDVLRSWRFRWNFLSLHSSCVGSYIEISHVPVCPHLFSCLKKLWWSANDVLRSWRPSCNFLCLLFFLINITLFLGWFLHRNSSCIYHHLFSCLKKFWWSCGHEDPVVIFSVCSLS